MSTPHKRSAAEAWEALRAMADEDDERWDDEAAEREAERILALSPEEVRRELIEAGLDPDEVRARGQQLMEQVLREMAAEPTPPETAAAPATSPTVPTPAPAAPARPKPAPAHAPRRAPLALWLLAAAFAAVLLSSWRFAGETIARWIHPAPPEPSILPDMPSPSLVAEARAKKHARDLRESAHAKCAIADWDACMLDLDEAAKLDPAGDTDGTVQADRAAAKAAHENESRPIGPKPKP